MSPIRFTIFGQAASKANSRKLVAGKGGKLISIKSDAARAFFSAALRQVPPTARKRLSGPVCVSLRMFYATERPDLDESLVLDALQDQYKTIPLPGGRLRRELLQSGVYQNDRQVREKHVFHAIDKREPRVEIEITSIAATDDFFADDDDATLPF